jgi:Flp pilus assembly protein TadD
MKRQGIHPDAEPSDLRADGVRAELERVLKSHGFARNDRLSSFLAFVVQRHLEGRDKELKESVIGVEVFGRKPDYNPKDDPVVRTEARRLRARLDEYYAESGAADGLKIELPKGGYVPLVRRSAQITEPVRPSRARFKQWFSIASVAMGLILAATGWTRLNSRDQLRHKTNPVAYDLYLRARSFQTMPSVTGIESSIDLFRQAIRRDHSFAAAYAGVAAGCAARSAFDGFDAVQRASMISEGWSAAEKALQLDPVLADVHDALGMMQARAAQWNAAERSFLRAIELAPRDILWRDHLAMFLLLPLGRIDEAITQLRIAEELDPLSPETHMALSLALTSARRYDEALFHCNKAAWNDQRRSSCWAQILLSQGRTEEAIRTLEPLWTGHLMEPGAQILGIAYANAGRRDDAERIAAMVPRQASKTYIFAALGDKDRTFQMLDRMIPMGPTRIGRDFLINPRFAFLQGDPRLKSIRKMVGLPE